MQINNNFYLSEDYTWIPPSKIYIYKFNRILLKPYVRFPLMCVNTYPYFYPLNKHSPTIIQLFFVCLTILVLFYMPYVGAQIDPFVPAYKKIDRKFVRFLFQSIIDKSLTANLFKKEEVESIDNGFYLVIGKLIQFELLIHKVSEPLIYEVPKEKKEEHHKKYLLTELLLEKTIESMTLSAKAAYANRLRCYLVKRDQELSESEKKICHLIEELVPPGLSNYSNEVIQSIAKNI